MGHCFSMANTRNGRLSQRLLHGAVAMDVVTVFGRSTFISNLALALAVIAMQPGIPGQKSEGTLPSSPKVHEG